MTASMPSTAPTVATVIPASDPMWEGSWVRVGMSHLASATLNITKVTSKGFSFELFANWGGNVGQIIGEASFQNETAIFKSKDVEASLVFTINGPNIKVESGGNVSYFGGMNVTFHGEFQRGPLQEETTLITLGIMPDQSSDERFRKLVGEQYFAFVDSFQIYSTGTDEDQLGATVITGGVPGLFTIMEAIIMRTPDNGVWTAVLNNGSILVYSNRDKPAGIPKTIQKWSARFKDTTVKVMPPAYIVQGIQRPDIFEVTWSPSKQSVVYAQGDAPGRGGKVYVWRAGEDDPKPVAFEKDILMPIGSFTWSADNRFVLYTFGVAAVQPGHLINAVTSTLATVLTVANRYYFSPDSKQLLYARPVDLKSPYVKAGSGDSFDLMLLDLQSLQETVILKADPKLSYFAEGWIDAESIRYTKVNFETNKTESLEMKLPAL
ncbi:hypothetical protein [Paenibacillus koleovorans]|uniref:hypothetical protein n=1 Tax=Paenibacillus koleovorans TaxID=121608 RepID=UPI000FDBCE51|nr:hypothetical protein [Paenibacillus koleovorans]